MLLDSINEVHIRGRNDILLPYASRPLYFDKKKLILSQFIREDSTPDEPSKSRSGYKIISKCRIDDTGKLIFLDSVRIGQEDSPIVNDFILHSNPIIITAPLAVEGGSCNNGYSIYDESLKFIGKVDPNLPSSCGVNSKIFWEKDKINFIDQDPIQNNVFSWCKSDFQLKSIDCKQLKVEDGFTPYTTFIINGDLFITGNRNDSIEFCILVYSPDGRLKKRINTFGLLVQDMNVIGNEIMYFGSRLNSHKVIVLDKGFKQKSIFNTTSRTALAPNKVLTFTNNKIYTYEAH